MRPSLFWVAWGLAGLLLTGCATPVSSCGAGHEEIARQVAADRARLEHVRREIREREEHRLIYGRIWECVERAEAKPKGTP